MQSIVPCCCPTPSVTCTPCPIPKRNLSIAIANLFSGPYTVPLIYLGGTSWSSGCVVIDGLLYTLACVSGQTVFTITYWLTGVCPTGQSSNCISNGANPHRIILSSYTCTPFALHYSMTAASCPIIQNNGYSTFDIT